jgi:hypothetical protein
MALDLGEMIFFENETVYTVNDYWDGPRVGVAGFKGQPHHFECVFNEVLDAWSSIFWLHSMEPETFNLVMEQWSLWERWREAHGEGKVSNHSHPCLPEDRSRYDAISIVLEKELRIDRSRDIQAEGRFKTVGPPGQPTNVRRWTVTWQERFSDSAVQQALGTDSP